MITDLFSILDLVQYIFDVVHSQISLKIMSDYNYTRKVSLSYSDGSSYEGDWKDGLWHGKGTHIWPRSDGRKYEGDWIRGNRHGRGIITWLDG